MDLDPEGIFRDDSDEDDDNLHEREANKEMVVYLIDASPKMFTPATAAQVKSLDMVIASQSKHEPKRRSRSKKIPAPRDGESQSTYNI